MKKNLVSDNLKKDVCNGCLEALKEVMSEEDIEKFKQEFYKIADNYIFEQKQQ